MLAERAFAEQAELLQKTKKLLEELKNIRRHYSDKLR